MLILKMVVISGHVRNIYFPFDTEIDTALSVATEMVSELDITDQDVTKIAEMIDGEIASLVPEWKPGFGIDESANIAYSSPHPGKTVHGCGSVHGRFEEITYQVEGSEQCVTDSAPVGSSQSDVAHYTDIWAQQEDHEVSSPTSNEILDQPSKEKERIIRNGDGNEEVLPTTSNSALHDDYENEIWQELRWFKAKYKKQLRDRSRSYSSITKGETDEYDFDCSSNGKHFTLYPLTDSDRSTSDPKVYSYESVYNSCSPVHLVTAKSFYSGGLLSHSLHRATSLPVDTAEL